MHFLQVADSSTILKLHSVTIEWLLYDVCATECNFGYKVEMMKVNCFCVIIILICIYLQAFRL